MSRFRFGILFGIIIGAALFFCSIGICDSESDVEKAYSELVSADHWRKARAASDKLSTYGEDALPYVLKGIKHEDRKIREYCYEILRTSFGEHPDGIEAIIDGLNDESSGVSYPCAFHLGEHGIGKAKDALRICVEDTERDDRTRYGAAKSLAELGEKDMIILLNAGVGSDDHYTRYLSNIGIKALCGKDLTDFGYEGPFEGAFTSGGAVMRVQGQHLEKAKRKLGRYQTIVSFLEWLKDERGDLFEILDKSW